jgi:hypothetical protein
VKDKVKVQVWRVPLEKGQVIRAATIEHGPRSANPNCDGCSSPCCKKLTPVLTASEFLFKKFKIAFRQTPKYIDSCAPEGKSGHLMVTVPEINDLCYYLDPETFKCRAWPDIPKACLAYDCRNEDRPELIDFIKLRKASGNWKET